MNHAERFRAVVSFQPVDRLPRWEWATWWDKTILRWRGEGLPERAGSTFEIAEHLGLDPYIQFWFWPGGPEAGRRIGSVDEYLEILPRLYPDQADLLEAMKPWVRKQERGEALVWFTLEGFFWYPRTLLGIEEHLTAFYEKPELIKRINRDLAEYSLRLLGGISAIGSPCFMTFAEDMSYNHGPMLSKAMFDEFLAPHYRALVPVLNEMGTIPVVDTDGDLTRMIPWLEEVGITAVLPLERNAGVDAALLRERHPKLRMIGHYDKMVMNKGEAAIRAEFERLLPVMRKGGFIASVDHQTPPGVSLSEYRIYLRLLEEYSALGARR